MPMSFFSSCAIQVSGDGRRIFTISGNSVKVFNVERGVCERTIQTEENDQITQFVLNPTNEVLYCISRVGDRSID